MAVHLKEVKTMMMKVKKKPTGSMKPIAPFKTLEEEANYWDTHSPVDDMDENTPVIVHRAKRPRRLPSGLTRRILLPFGSRQTSED
jgi:hypothetical protein